MAALRHEGLAIRDITPAYLTPNDAQPAFTNGDDPARVALLAEYLGRAKRAQTWANQHREAWSAKYAELTKLSPDVAHDMFEHYAPVYVPIDEQVINVQQELADAFLDAGVLDRTVARTLSQSTFTGRAQRRGVGVAREDDPASRDEQCLCRVAEQAIRIVLLGLPPHVFYRGQLYRRSI